MKERKKISPKEAYVLDSHALLLMLEDRAGAEEVNNIIASSDTEVYMSVINLGEVLYIVERRGSYQSAMNVKKAVVESDGIELVDVTLERVSSAARIKSKGKLSYADCFAVALAKEINAIIVTGDSEFLNVEPEVKIKWLPDKKS